MCCDAPMLARLILVVLRGRTLKLINRIKGMIARRYEGENWFGLLANRRSWGMKFHYTFDMGIYFRLVEVNLYISTNKNFGITFVMAFSLVL